jgi:hypothetical protein
MKIGKRVFISSLKSDFLALLFGWVFLHFISWLFNGCKGFESYELLLLSFGLTLYMLLVMGSFVNKKGEFKLGLPFLNSYLKAGEKLVFKPGGFNLVIRAFYFLVATYALFGNMKINEFYDSTLSDKIYSILFLLILVGSVVKAISDRNDFLIIDAICISWFDNDDKEVKSLLWGDIQQFSIKSDTDSGGLETPRKIVFQTSAGESSLDIEGLAIAQYFDLITEQLEMRIGK